MENLENDKPEFLRPADPLDRGGIEFGKVTYCVLAALAVSAFFLPSFLMEKVTYYAFVLIVPALFLALILTAIGVWQIARYKRIGTPSRFWQVATLFAALPLITSILLIFWNILTNSPPVFGNFFTA